jgi:hypothetical protein
MADNITAPVPTGTVVATDEISGRHYQKVKVAFGEDDTATSVSPGNPLPVAASLALKYTAADPTYSDGNAAIPMRADQHGALLVNNVTAGAGDDYNNQVVATLDKPIASPSYAPLRYQSPGTPVLLKNIKSAAGAVQAINIYNFGAAIAYLQIHNLNTDPSGTSSIAAAWPIPAGSATNPGVLNLTKAQLGGLLYCTLGVGFAISTTPTGFSQSGLTAANFYEDIAYV